MFLVMCASAIASPILTCPAGASSCTIVPVDVTSSLQPAGPFDVVSSPAVVSIASLGLQAGDTIAFSGFGTVCYPWGLEPFVPGCLDPNMAGDFATASGAAVSSSLPLAPNQPYFFGGTPTPVTSFLITAQWV